MRRILIYVFTAVVTALSIGCKPDEEKEPEAGISVPEIILDNEGGVNIPAEGGRISVPFHVVNPYDGGEVSADSESDWLSLSCSDSEVSVEAVPNTDTLARTAAVSVCYTYGEAGDTVMARFDVVQAAGEEQEPETEYDYEFEASYFSGTYFGDLYGQNGEYCYDAYLMDKPMDGDYFAAGTTAYLFDIFTTAPEDSGNPVPAPGIYTLGEPYATVSMTFTPDLSCRMYQNEDGSVTRIYLSEGTLTISEEGGNVLFEAFLVDVDGKTHHVTYSGPTDYVSDGAGGGDGGIEALDMDLDIKAGIADASWLADAGNDIMEVNIAFTDMDTDDAGYVIPPGSILYVDAFMPFDEDGTLAVGTYDFSHDIGEVYALYPGEIYEVMAGVFLPSGTYADYMLTDEQSLTGLIEEGSMTVEGSAGNYTVECVFTTVEGYSVKCSYSGDLTVRNIPEPISTLTEDLTLNLSGATGYAEYYGDYYGTGGGNWIIAIETEDDSFMADIVVEGNDFSNGIVPGVYVAAALYPSPGEYAPGRMSYTGQLTGTMYYGGYEGEYVTEFAPAVSGDLLIEKNADGTYSISFAFLDDKDNTWDGNWKGVIDMVDFSGYGFVAPASAQERRNVKTAAVRTAGPGLRVPPGRR